MIWVGIRLLTAAPWFPETWVVQLGNGRQDCMCRMYNMWWSRVTPPNSDFGGVASQSVLLSEAGPSLEEILSRHGPGQGVSGASSRRGCREAWCVTGRWLGYHCQEVSEVIKITRLKSTRVNQVLQVWNNYWAIWFLWAYHALNDDPSFIGARIICPPDHLCLPQAVHSWHWWPFFAETDGPGDHL